MFIAGDYSLPGHRRDRVGVATMLGIYSARLSGMQVTREVAETALPDYSRSGSHDSRILDEKLWILRTRDMSNSGVFLERDGQQCPPVGTELEVRISGPVGGGAPQ